MKNLGNQRGYALLIVMLTIIIFLSLSAVFVKTSLSHVTQEQTVDVKNQAVVAAEMGVKKITTDLQNEINSKIKEIKTSVQIQKDEILACQESKICSFTEVNTRIATLNEEKTNEFNKFITLDLKQKINEKYLEPDYLNNSPTQPMYFKLSNYQFNKRENDVQVDISVTGHSNDKADKVLTAHLNIELIENIYSVTDYTPITIAPTNQNTPVKVFPNTQVESCNMLLNKNLTQVEKPYNCKLFSTDKVGDLINTIKSKNLLLKDFNIFIDSFDESVCSDCNSNKIKDLFGLNLFVNGDSDLKNLNNLKNAQIFVDGDFQGKNANNLGNNNSHTFIVARSFDIKNNNGITNSTIVLLGYDNNTSGVFDYHNKFILNEGSKFCINLDRFTRDSKVNVSKIRGGGEVFYFSNNIYPFPDDIEGKKKKEVPEFKHISDYQTFLTNCGVDSFNLEGKTIYVPNMTEDIPYSQIIDVNY